MSGIETYGGCCPKCLKGMEQKWESSGYGLMFDACPWCGFARGTIDAQEINDPNRIWESILEHHGCSTREELIEKNESKPYTPLENLEFFPSIYDYSNELDTSLLYQLLWKKYANGNVEEFDIVGRKVRYKEEGVGTLMDYKDGVLYILWDEHQGSKLPYFDYPATDLGVTIQLVESLS